MLNVAVIRGRLSRPAEMRLLPSGSKVVQLEVSVRHDDGPTDNVPVACYDPPAAVAGLVEDEEIWVIGRVRRRFFRAGGSTGSRTEVVADTVATLRQVKKVDAALTRVLDELAVVAKGRTG